MTDFLDTLRALETEMDEKSKTAPGGERQHWGFLRDGIGGVIKREEWRRERLPVPSLFDEEAS